MLFVFVLFATGRASALELADVAMSTPYVDLSTNFAGLKTDKQTVTIERPDQAIGAKQFMTLQAQGSAPFYYWVAAGFTNSATDARKVVIVIPDRGFVGSGIIWPRLPGTMAYGVVTAGPIELQPVPALGGRAFSFTLAPKATAAIAIQTRAPVLDNVQLWQDGAFGAQKDYYAFFRGALLGISVLLALAMLALYGFRARSIFLAAGGLAFACVGFIALEAGHISSFFGRWVSTPYGMGSARALIEGLMAAFLLLGLGTLSEFRRLSQTAANVVSIVGLIVLALPLYGLLQPDVAAGLARMVFAATAIFGFSVVLLLWHRGEENIQMVLVTWSAILLWTFLAAIAALGDPRASHMGPIVLAGLCTVLVVMAFTLAHFAFSQGYLSRHFFREAGRRALALAGARAYVWDWQPEEGDLFVGEEIEAALGLQPGIMAEGAESFLEILHPSDRDGYLAAIEAAESEGRGIIEREFRLRHGNGSWRWFQLRARAVSGLGGRAIRCIGTLTDITNAKLTEERLLDDAIYDTVTGLPNRALLMDRLGRSLTPGEATSATDVHIALIDIDRFKIMNDGLGHESGDSLLSVIGRRLSAAARTSDTVARLPGDQFAVLFTGGPTRDVLEFTESLRRSVARPVLLDEQELFLTACIGIARGGEPGIKAEQLMKDAAIALYEAKRQGPDSVAVFHEAMRDDRAELVVLESELRRAIERNEIEVHYQPIARLADMNLAGFEALVRWRHPVLGLLAPESFIGLAEQTGLIRDIGSAVINEAARQLGIWQRAFRPAEPIFVAVNVSSAQLIDAVLIDEIKQVLHREGVHRQTLKIEVTESIVMQFPERAAMILERLRELGVGLACDDFGTGYSSLSTLRKLPFDTLKIDKSFIGADAQDERATIILQAMTSMARNLGLQVVAEGIESQEQVDRLGELECDLGQGYFIGAPMTAKQVSDALAGLPYASASGRTAITWMWERSAREPALEPAAMTVTARGISETRARLNAELAATRPPPPPTFPLPDAQPQAGATMPPAFAPRKPEADVAQPSVPSAEPQPSEVPEEAAVTESAPEPEVSDLEAVAGVMPAEDAGQEAERAGEPQTETATVLADTPSIEDSIMLAAESAVVAINRTPAPRRRRRHSKADAETGQA